MSYSGRHLLFVYLSLMALEASALSFHYNFSIPSDAEDLTYMNDSFTVGNWIELTTNIKGKPSVWLTDSPCACGTASRER
jgi:hypothetical protein